MPRRRSTPVQFRRPLPACLSCTCSCLLKVAHKTSAKRVDERHLLMLNCLRKLCDKRPWHGPWHPSSTCLPRCVSSKQPASGTQQSSGLTAPSSGGGGCSSTRSGTEMAHSGRNLMPCASAGCALAGLWMAASDTADFCHTSCHLWATGSFGCVPAHGQLRPSRRIRFALHARRCFQKEQGVGS